MTQYGWHVNINNCIACRACEGACKAEYNLPVGVRRRIVLKEDGISLAGNPYIRHISTACNHCETAACISACPVGRYWKDDATNSALRTAFGMSGNTPTGLVQIKPSAAQDPVNGVDCLGCKRCMAACPYGAITFDEEKQVADKCTGCYQRLFNVNLPVERRKPACVVTCTADALTFGDMTVIAALPGVQATTGAPVGATPPAKEIADPSFTNPSIRFTPQTIV